MTTEELCTEIERLDAAATAGPWSYERDTFDMDEGPVWCIEDVAKTNIVLAKVFIDESDTAEGDAELIASYRTLAVEAAKKLREMQARCTELEDNLFGKETTR